MPLYFPPAMLPSFVTLPAAPVMKTPFSLPWIVAPTALATLPPDPKSMPAPLVPIALISPKLVTEAASVP